MLGYILGLRVTIPHLKKGSKASLFDRGFKSMGLEFDICQTKL